MRVLVTGAGGFMGTNLVAHLINQGHRVCAFDVIELSAHDFPITQEQHSLLTCATGSVTDYNDCCNAAQGCDTACHLAAKVSDFGPQKIFNSINVEGTKNMFQACQQQQVKRFVFISSVAVHHFNGITEGHEELPLNAFNNPYAISKIAAETYISQSDTTMEWVILRPGVFPFGPRDFNHFAEITKRLQKQQLPMISHGKALVTTVYIENLLQGIMLALTHPQAPGEVFIIGDDHPISWNDLFSKICEQVNCPSPQTSFPKIIAVITGAIVEFIYKLLLPHSFPPLTRYRISLSSNDCVFHSTKAKHILGYNPQYSFEQGLVKTMNWYKQTVTTD